MIQYRLPTVSQKLLQKVWLHLFIISRRTFCHWSSNIGKSSSILPLDHGVTFWQRNNYKPSALHVVSQYIESFAAVDVHPLPIKIRTADGEYVDSWFDTEKVIVLPPCHSITSLFEGYKQCTEKAPDRIAVNNFRAILSTEMPRTHVSLQTRGICDTCFVFRKRVRTFLHIN